MSKTDHEHARDLRRDEDDRLDLDAADDVRDGDDTPDESDDDDAHDAADVGMSVEEESRRAQLWLAAACVCLLAAAVLWLSDNADAAFVIAALGVLAWFLNVRVQLRKK